MNKLAITIITILLTAILGMLAYMGNATISGVESLQNTLTEIRLDVAKVIIEKENLKDQVNRLEIKVDRKQDKKNYDNEK